MEADQERAGLDPHRGEGQHGMALAINTGHRVWT